MFTAILLPNKYLNEHSPKVEHFCLYFRKKGITKQHFEKSITITRMLYSHFQSLFIVNPNYSYLQIILFSDLQLNPIEHFY